MDTYKGVAKDSLVRRLKDARERPRWLLRRVSDENLEAQHDQIMSPLIEGHGHTGNYEELWLLNRAFDKGLSDRELYDVYDAPITPRSERPSFDLLDRESPTATSTPSVMPRS